MTRSLIPPRYVNIPSSLAYGDLPKSVIVSGLRIIGLAWCYRYERTDPISIEDLCQICSVTRSNMYGHLGQLLAANVFQYTTVAGRLTFTFQQSNPSPVFRTDPTLGGAVDPEIQQQQYSHAFDSQGESEGDGVQSCFRDWQERLDILDYIGVREPVRSEIAGLEHASVEYLEGWAGWFHTQSELGVGALIPQLRANVPAPETHDKYIGGRYSQFIRH